MGNPTKTAQQVWQTPAGEDFLQCLSPNGSIVSWIDSSGIGRGFLSPGILPAYGTYIISISGGVVSAQNAVTGIVDFSSSTDAAVVFRSVIAAMPTGGTIFVKNGIYNFSSVLQETTGGYNLFYCVAFPANAGSVNQYAVWRIIGESAQSVVGTAAQTSGVIFNVTTTAETAAGAGNVLDAFWHRPDTVNHTGNDITFENCAVLFPNNQRGNENAFDMREVDTIIWRNTVAAFNASWGAPGPSTTYAAPATGLNGYLTPVGSRGDTVRLDNTWAVGYDTAYNIQGDHSNLNNASAQLCRWFARYAGSPYPAIWTNLLDQDNLNGIQINGGTTPTSSLYLLKYHVEQDLSGPFTRQFDITETNPGQLSGVVYYTKTNFGGTPISTPNIFNGGGGQNFITVNGETGRIIYPFLGTTTNAKVNSVSPAAAGVAASGSFTVPTTTTNYTVNTTAVTANSQIFLTPRTDNTSIPGAPTLVAPAAGFVGVVSRVAGTSFTINLPSTTGITCFDYFIIN